MGFAHRLALHMGILRPQELLKCLTSAELSDWISYFKAYPFGQDHTDLILAMICQRLSAGKSDLADYLPYRAERQLTTEEFTKYLSGIFDRGNHRKS